MLLRQNGCGHEDGYLPPVHYRLESGTDGYFRLAVAHIPADEAVHRAGLFHVFFHFPDGV